MAYVRSRGIEPAITASTGIAATHIGGMTIHSWSGIGIRAKLSKEDLGSITTSDYIAKRVRRAKILIIDEVSMLAPATLAMVDAICREIKQSADRLNSGRWWATFSNTADRESGGGKRNLGR